MTELGTVPISNGDEIQDVADIALLEKVLPLVPIITYERHGNAQLLRYEAGKLVAVFGAR